ncbi:MAG: hypothetical protein IH612_01160, partial [Desulfofustis sp.]|nr:hypothetical protein [Desulfofustis sp.]
KFFDGLSTGSNSDLLVTGFEYELGWCDRDPFLQVPWIEQFQQYGATLVLVSEYGLRVELASYEASATGQCYKIPVTFGTEHIGTWRLRVEMDTDANEYVESAPFTIEYREATRYALGQRIIPPDDTLPGLKPDIADDASFYWSLETNRLYAIAPTTSMLTWYKDEGRTDPVPMVAYVTYPNRQDYPTDPLVQLHIAESQPVDLFPAGTPFDSARLMYLENDATISANLFQATTEGWSLIFYRDDQAQDPDLMEHFDVVSTYVWNHDKNPNRPDNPVLNPDFPFEKTVDIGKELTDSYHNQSCANGYIFFPDAYYDGYGDSRAYDRDSRTGPIFIVNENDPELIEDDPVVIWYHRSAVSNVCWPSKPVHYETPWPADARKIVIASRLGSGPLSPENFGQPANMMIYNQPDPDEIGYNPNEEHADFFTASGSAYPAVYALRDDLHRTTWNNPRRPFTSKPYALLKYIDPEDGRWNFEVFEVTAQSPRYERSGTIVENEATTARYYINTGGILTPWAWPAPLPGDGYYLDADGLVRKHGDDTNSCYNVSNLSTPLSNCTGAKIHYINSIGNLVENSNQPANGFSFNGLLLPGTLDVDDAYFLSEYGMLVKGDTFYRFYYPKEAGDEINPPYPLNQMTFGPCPESYFRSTDLNKVLRDKDDKFFAKHGGLGDDLAVDVVLNFYYRMQAGYWYDLDANGYPDVAIGTPLAWLDGLDHNFDGATPVPTTYAIFWPDPVPTLYVGETLTDAKTQEGESVGLPNIKDQ